MNKADVHSGIEQADKEAAPTIAEDSQIPRSPPNACLFPNGKPESKEEKHTEPTAIELTRDMLPDFKRILNEKGRGDLFPDICKGVVDIVQQMQDSSSSDIHGTLCQFFIDCNAAIERSESLPSIDNALSESSKKSAGTVLENKWVQGTIEMRLKAE
ncbi:MAG: hypothetical protein K9M03_04275 [Kiritimatiellales bacterium]|nr:hypothetical protein [Kiritimatiellales bacterium]